MINLIVHKTMLAELELAKDNIDRPRKEMKLYLPKKLLQSTWPSLQALAMRIGVLAMRV